MTTKSRFDKIRAFRSMIERELSWKFDVSEFEDRLRMQKLVYISGEFGLNHGYVYNMYLHGPYSPELAGDYYEEDFAVTPSGVEMPTSFNLVSFLGIVEGKSTQWLEIAATAHSLSESYSETHSGQELDERVVSATSEKKDVPLTEVDAIYRELKSRGVVSS